jgi:membrane protein implicated in regulation of membrane protease activity
MASIFATYTAQNILLPSYSMMAITACFQIPTATRSSLVTVQRSSRVGAATFSLVSVVAAVVGRPTRGPSSMTCSSLLKRSTQCLNELISTASSPYKPLRRIKHQDESHSEYCGDADGAWKNKGITPEI